MPEETHEETEVRHKTFKVYGGAARCFISEDLELLAESGAGTGKSRTIMEMANARCRNYPKSRHLFARQTRKSLSETVLPDFENEVLWENHPAIHGNAARENRNKYLYPNGSEIILAGLETMRDEGNPILSAQYDTITVFQAEETTEEIWEKLMTRLRNGKMPFAQIIADVNPSHKYHWLNQRPERPKCPNMECPLFEQNREPEGEVGEACEGCGSTLTHTMTRVPFRHEDNPRWFDHEAGKWTEDGKVYRRDILGSLTGARRERLLFHRWVSEEGQVFEEYKDEIHLLSGRYNKDDQGIVRSIDIREWSERVKVEWYHACMDFGFRAPCSIQVWAHDSKGRTFLVAEVYKTKKDLDWHAEALTTLHDEFPFTTVVADSSEGGTGAHEMLQKRLGKLGGRRTKVMVVKADKVKGKTHGLDVLRDGLKLQDPSDLRSAKIYFLRDTLRFKRDEELSKASKPYSLIHEIPALVWLKSEDGRPVKEIPDPACADHGIDAWTYGHNWAWGKSLKKKREPRRYGPGTYGYLGGHDNIPGGRPTGIKHPTRRKRK